MASRVDFSVSVIPVYTKASDSEGPAVDVLASDVGKYLGSSGSVAVTWGSTIGYSSGSPAYVIAGTSDTSLGTFTSVKFVYIKHTGYSDSGLTTATTANLTVKNGTTVLAILGPGDSIVLPYVGGHSPALKGLSSSGNIAVEVMGTP